MEEFVCPVCNKSHISSDKLFRHMMNSYGEKSHSEYIKKQNERIKEIYLNHLYTNFIMEEIVLECKLICSPTYVRNIFRTFPDYKERLSVKRSSDTSNQYCDGRRIKQTSFNNGWRPSREKGGKRYIPKEKYDKIIKLYSSNLEQKEIAEMVNCKQETVHKILVEKFGKKEVHRRNMDIKIAKITKLTTEVKQKLDTYFYEDMPKREIAEKLEISEGSVLSYYRKTFSKKERKDREKRLQKYAIKKSLQVCGKLGTTGSKPENYCYELLCKEISEEVKHHDFDLCPPYEVDITIPYLKIAVSWDGPFHRHPLFGEKTLQKNKERDGKKISRLLADDWRVIVVEDNCSKFTPDFVEDKVSKIMNLIKTDWKGKIII